MATVPPRTTDVIGKDKIWLYKQYEGLCKDYPNEVVVAYNFSVLVAAPSFGHAMQAIAKMGYRWVDVVPCYVNPDPGFVKSFIESRNDRIKAIERGDW